MHTPIHLHTHTHMTHTRTHGTHRKLQIATLPTETLPTAGAAPAVARNGDGHSNMVGTIFERQGQLDELRYDV